MNAGYNSLNDFCINNGLKYRAVLYAYDLNKWTKPMLEKIGNSLKVNLAMYENSAIGKVREVYANEDKYE